MLQVSGDGITIQCAPNLQSCTLENQLVLERVMNSETCAHVTDENKRVLQKALTRYYNRPTDTLGIGDTAPIIGKVNLEKEGCVNIGSGKNLEKYKITRQDFQIAIGLMSIELRLVCCYHAEIYSAYITCGDNEQKLKNTLKVTKDQYRRYCKDRGFDFRNLLILLASYNDTVIKDNFLSVPEKRKSLITTIGEYIKHLQNPQKKL